MFRKYCTENITVSVRSKWEHDKQTFRERVLLTFLCQSRDDVHHKTHRKMKMNLNTSVLLWCPSAFITHKWLHLGLHTTAWIHPIISPCKCFICRPALHLSVQTRPGALDTIQQCVGFRTGYCRPLVFMPDWLLRRLLSFMNELNAGGMEI